MKKLWLIIIFPYTKYQELKERRKNKLKYKEKGKKNPYIYK